MDTKSLRDHLTQLRAELGASASVDPETKRLLGDIMGDILRLTESPRADEQSSTRTAPAPRLEAVAVRFEADHPAIAASIRRLIDLLGNVGV